FIRSGDGEDLGEKPVRLDQLEQLPLKDVLRHLLQQVSDAEEVGYVIEEGAVVVGPRTGLEVPTYYQSYEVSDIIKPKPDYPAPPIALDENAGQGAGGTAIQIDLGGDTPTGGGTLPKDQLLELIARELRGPEATEVEGIQFLEGKLSARITLEEHIKLAKILDQLRLSTGMMVTCESRFLDIQDNFLEQIGINFGGTQSNLPK